VAADSTSAVGAVSLSPDRSQLWSRAADFAVSESFATSSSDTPGSVGERCSSSPSTCQKGSCVFVRKLRVEVSRCLVLFLFFFRKLNTACAFSLFFSMSAFFLAGICGDSCGLRFEPTSLRVAHAYKSAKRF